MYKVYCDSYLIYDAKVPDLALIDAKLELELNRTGSFNFTIYPDHPYFNKLEKLKSIITVYQDDYLIFRGRILNDEDGFYNEKQVSCEGELAFLLDSIQRPYDFFSGEKHTTISELFTFFINNHNSQVGADRQFIVGNITVTDPNDYIVRSDSTYLNTWDSINQKLIETNGGYLWVRHEPDGNYIDYLADFNTLSNQTIEFGKNLLDLDKVTKGEEIATAIIPLGARISDDSEERLTIKSVNDDFDYVFDTQAVKQYGWIYKTVTWDDVTVASNLRTKAEQYLANSINLIVSIELNAFDLSALDADISSFRMGTYIKVHTSPHSLDSNFLIKKLSLDLLNPQFNKLTIGTTYSTFTEQASGTSQNYQKTIGDLNYAVVGTNSKLQEINKYIQFVDGNIVLGEDQNKLLLKIKNNKISFAFNEASEADKMEIGMDVDVTGKLLQEEWQTPTLLNSWVNYGTGYESAYYCKDKCNIVHLTGLIKAGVTTAETVIFNLPEGYRPKAIEKFFAISVDSICVIEISATGDVKIKSGANSEWLSLSGICFRAN